MAVKLRMTRMGRRHRPFFRINAVESKTPRDGRILEKLGHYDPLEKDSEKQLVLNLDRVKYWLDNGAVPSDTIAEILLRQGIKTKYLEEKSVRLAKARSQARAKGKLFNKAEKIAAEKAADKVKAEEEAKAKAAEEAAKKAEAEAKAKADAEAKAAEEAAKAQETPAAEPEQKEEPKEQ